MYRIKHIPTGLYYQPRKYRGNNLSKNGKVYHTNIFRPTVLVLTKGSRVYNEIKNNLPNLINTKGGGNNFINLFTHIDDFKIEEV